MLTQISPVAYKQNSAPQGVSGFQATPPPVHLLSLLSPYSSLPTLLVILPTGHVHRHFHYPAHCICSGVFHQYLNSLLSLLRSCLLSPRRYFKVDFTKNPEKYIKYSPADVSNMVDKFFDVAA